MTRLRPASLDDAGAIAAIYAPYVLSSPFTFETEAPDEAEIKARIQSGGGFYPWFVAEDDRILGYAYAARFRPRSAYRFTVETSVYVDPAGHRRGIGASLYRLLLATLKEQGFTQAIAAITLPNGPSVHLHESVGYVLSGVYRKVGYKLGAWHDVGLWQCALAPPVPDPPDPRPFDPEIAIAMSRQAESPDSKSL